MRWLLLFLIPAAWANDTAMHDGGSGPEPVGWKKDVESIIRMVREEVEVEMNPYDSAVTCRFIFVSGKKDAPAVQFLGFPDITRSSEYEGDTMGPLRDMRTFVNGREVKSNLVSKRLETDGTWTDLAEPDPPCETWHVVKVSFPPGEEVVVERRFRTDNGQTAGGPVFFGYTTETGGNWHGTIGHGKFIVHLAEGMQAAKLATEPAIGWRRSDDGRTLTLEWKNFEPRTEPERTWWSVGWFPKDGVMSREDEPRGSLKGVFAE